ncbi:MAG: hypothetical protein KGL94_05685 [Acidobacteriota bacterium]|nr:hypothetical protein [Acidobacteriota bacterium]
MTVTGTRVPPLIRWMAPETDEHQRPAEDWPMPTRDVLLTLQRLPDWGLAEPQERAADQRPAA